MCMSTTRDGKSRPSLFYHWHLQGTPPNEPVFPILGVFRLKGQPKRDGSIIVRSARPVNRRFIRLRDAILAVNHDSCPPFSSSYTGQWGRRRIEDKPTPWSALPLGKIVVVPSLSLAPAITGRYDPTLPRTTVEEPTPRTTERSTTARAAPDDLPS